MSLSTTRSDLPAAPARPDGDDPAVPAGPAGPAGHPIDPAGFSTGATPAGPSGTSGAGPEVELIEPIPESLRPVFRVHRRAWRWTDAPDENPRPPGLWWHGLRTVDRRTGESEPVDRRLCGPLWVAALSRDGAGNGFALVLQFRDLDDRERQLNLPRNLLAGGGPELERQLLAAGLDLEPDSGRLLVGYLLRARPKRRLTVVHATGWTDGFRSFVLPDRTIGEEPVILEPAHVDTRTTAGDFGRWREAVALLEGNPLPAFVLMLALSGPLMRPVGRHSGGVHFHGPTTGGKTTSLRVAASVWGPPDRVVRTWNATRNGVEAVAAASNDMLLALDEISEARPEVVDRIVYQVCNDTGRSRAERDGSRRPLQRWTVAFLSAGEKSLALHLELAGLRPPAGMRVRLLDLPVTGRFGVFDELHHLPSARHLAEHLAAQVAAHHGHAGPALLRYLLASGGVDRVVDLYRQIRERPPYVGATAAAGRGASLFALAAVAGRLAVEAGILPWSPAFVPAVCEELFARWCEHEAPRDPGSEAQARICEFLDRHGADRFAPLGRPATVRDRAGWFEDDGHGRTWYFLPTALRGVIGDLPEKEALQALAMQGVLIRGESGHLTVKKRIEGRRRRVYAIRFGDET